MSHTPPPAIAMRKIPTVIDGFRGAGLVIEGRYYAPPLLLAPDPVELPGLTLESISRETFAPVGKSVEVVLIGTGATFRRLPLRLQKLAHACGLRAEAMDNHAAARTFNLLWVEGREVAALLL